MRKMYFILILLLTCLRGSDCCTSNVTLEQTSNLIASTTPGGSVTLNCTLNTTGLQVHWWYMNAHELPDDTSINIESIKFQRRSHINYTINTYPLGNEMVHSITLENLAESDNYAMVACVMDQPPCSTKPPHPFVLLVNARVTPSPTISSETGGPTSSYPSCTTEDWPDPIDPTTTIPTDPYPSCIPEDWPELPKCKASLASIPFLVLGAVGTLVLAGTIVWCNRQQVTT